MSTYKAGTAWLEIIPSFKGIESSLAAEVEKLSRKVDEALATSIPEGIRKGSKDAGKEMEKTGSNAGKDFTRSFSKEIKAAEKEMDKAGEEGAMRYAGAFKRSLRARSGPAQSAIPKIEIDGDFTPLEKRLAQVRKNLSTLDTAYINDRIKEPTLFAGMEGQRRALQRIQGEATKFSEFHNARAAMAELDQWQSMVRNGHSAGFGGGLHGGAFNRTIESQLRDTLNAFPKGEPGARTSDAQIELLTIRNLVGSLSRQRIGIDIDEKLALTKIEFLKRHLDELAKHPTEVQVRTDAAEASKGLDNILKSVAAKADTAGAEAGDRFGGRFAEKLSHHTNKAMGALPNLDGNTDGATNSQLRLNALRDGLDELSKKTIGVNIDEGTAIAHIEEIKRHLDDMARKDPSVRVRVEAAAASAELTEILVLAGRIDKSDPTVKVGVRNSAKKDLDETESSLEKLIDSAGIGGSRLAALISIGIALGSVLVPAAGAAAVAIGGIAQAAAAAGAGVGVFALGISGVMGGVQALNQYENDQAKSAASLSNSQERVAGALDAVQSAERSLANTRESVANSAKSAAQTVVDAQRSVIDSERNAVQAVKDLQKAYEDARRAEEDRALALRSNQLAQRQAVVDLANAKKALDLLMANPRATDLEREAAQITYQEKLLHIDDLAVKQKRLQEDAAKADKAGIEGSTQVVAAKEKVRAANESVSKAEEKLANAINAQQQQQRQGTFQLASATQAVENAQRQLGKAMTTAGVAGGAALANLQWAMQQLGPAGAGFAKFIFSLKQDFLDLRQTAQSSMLPGLQKAIEGLMRYLPQIKTFVGEVGAALGGIFIDLVAQLGNPTWQRFFGWIADTAVPTLQGMYKFFSLITQGVLDLLMALSPLNKQMGRGLIDMAQGFAEWAATLTMNSGYQKFLDYIAKTGPKVVELLAQMGLFIIRLVEAAAPMGATMLNVLVSMFKWLNNLPMTQLTTFVTILAGFYAVLLSITGISKTLGIIGTFFESFSKAQTKTWGGLKSLASDYRTELDRLNGTAQKVLQPAAGDFMASRLAQLTGGMRDTTNEAEKTTRGMGFLNRTLATGEVAGNTMKKGLSAVSGFLGGPLGIAVVGATLLLGSYYEQQAKIQSQANGMKGAIESIADAYLQGGDAAVSALARTNTAVRENLTALQQYGVTAQMVFQASQGSSTAQDAVVKSLEDRRAALDKGLSDAKDQANFWVWAFGFGGAEGGNSKLDQMKAIDALVPKLKEQYNQQRALAAAEAEAERTGVLFAGQMDNIKNVLDAANPTAKQYELAIKNLGDMHIGSASKLEGYLAISDRIAISSLAASDKASLFRNVLDQVGSAADIHGPTFDALSGVFGNIADSALSASDKTSLLKQSLDQLYGAAISQTEAEERMVRTQSDLSAQLSLSSAGFDLKTAKTDADKDAILRNRDALEAALEATRAKYVADIAAGETEQVARTRHDDMTTSILGQIDPTYRNSAAVNDLVTKYGAIPPERHTKITSEGSDKVMRDLYQGFLFQQALKDGLTPQDELGKWGSYDYWSSPQGLGHQGMNRADGGIIPGSSPHKRADNIPAWLTAGEWVQPVDSVDYYGHGVMEAMRRRLIPRELLNPQMLGTVNAFLQPRSNVYPGDGSSGIRFADGGAVVENYPISWQHVLMPVSLAELKGRLDRQEYGWTGPLPQNVKEIQQWLHAQDGKPYIWASAGPTGYDCSGIISAVYNLLKGENPYRHTFSTFDEGGYFTQPGYGLLTAGWTNPGEHGPGGDGVGHTAGMLGGLRFESTGDHVRVGHDVTPLTAFAHLAHAFANGGLVNAVQQPMLFDSGGRLPAGLGAYLNATGTPEHVLTDQQWNAVFELAQRPAQGQGQGNTYQFHMRDTDLTAGKLRALQAEDAVRAREGRAR